MIFERSFLSETENEKRTRKIPEGDIEKEKKPSEVFTVSLWQAEAPA
jgi:hypothetical protein